MVAVPAYIAANARRGLDLLSEGFGGDGLRPQTIREARALAGGNASEDKVTRMAAWYARHMTDLDSPRADAYLAGEADRPSPGQVAWLLWGGDLGANRGRAMAWAERTRDRIAKVAGSAARVGSAYLYAVPKPPGPTEFGTGVAVQVFRTGTIERAGDTREASTDDPAVLLQVYSVDEDRRLTRTDRQVLRSASELRAAGDISDRLTKQVSGRVRQTLENKVAEHNESHGGTASKRVNLRMLTAVFERGIGAYRNNPGSVRPNVASAEQWAYARVNAFLRAVRSGRFPRSAFDTDLLPEGHPLSTRKTKMQHDDMNQMPTFSPEIEERMAEHSAHHTDAHMRRMRELMAGGMSFDQAHAQTMEEEAEPQEDRTYPDGEPIPAALPPSYKQAETRKRCENCKYYRIGACMKWGAAVRANYVCKAWKPMLRTVEVDVESYYHDDDDEMKAHHDDEMKGYGYMDEDKAYRFQKEIVEEDGKFCVYSQGRGRKFGCYETRAAAQERLDQIESFSYSLESMTSAELIAAHQLTEKSVDSDMVALARQIIEDHLEDLGFAPPYTLGDTTTKLAALHQVVPFAKAEERYTLGPVYVPGRVDGHGEFITSATLQKAIWQWVRDGDRTIYLQHSEKAAGEMVEILTWPMPIQTSLQLPGEEVQKVEFPAETPFMGVVWESWAWDLVKAGQLRGYSIGGKARRVEADLSITPAGS